MNKKEQQLSGGEPRSISSAVGSAESIKSKLKKEANVSKKNFDFLLKKLRMFYLHF